jgi:catechol 2,3-dioxygenase-like lactoylglutathione lyase family enzyme
LGDDARVSLAIHHLALRVADPLASADFYTGVLGLPELRRFFDQDGRARAVWLRAGGAVLMLEREIKVRAAAEGSGHVLVFQVEALAPWEALLAKAGVDVEERTEFTVYFQDPDGHRVGLSVYQV